MIVSALLTSVGINTGLCVLLLSFYSVLRKQPDNVYVYAPRRVAEEQAKREGPFSLERLVPSPGWIVRAWRLSEDEFLSAAGFDAFVFLRIFIFRSCLDFFALIFLFLFSEPYTTWANRENFCNVIG